LFTYRFRGDGRSDFRGVVDARDVLETDLVAETAEQDVRGCGVPERPGAVCAEGDS
jgi:hypothetical protein